MVGFTAHQRELLSIFVGDLFSEVVDRRGTSNVSQSLSHSSSPTKCDGSVCETSTVGSGSFLIDELQPSFTLISNGDQSNENGENQRKEDSVSESSSSEDLNEYVDDDHLDEACVNKETSDDSVDEDLFESDEHCTNRSFTQTEIALALSLLKTRHSLTNTCVSNICKLLKLLHVSNCPSDFRHVRSLIYSPFKTTIFADVLITCPSCHKISSDSTHCTPTSNCVNKDSFSSNPTLNHILRLEPQIRSIIERNHLMKYTKDENSIYDIIDAPIYRKLIVLACL